MTGGDTDASFAEGRARVLTVLAATTSRHLRRTWGPVQETSCFVECALSLSVLCALRALTRGVSQPRACFHAAVQAADALVRRRFWSVQVFVAGLAFRRYVEETGVECVCAWAPCRCAALLEWSKALYEEGKPLVSGVVSACRQFSFDGIVPL